MSYKHHVFISYRREDRWTAWTRDYFKRELAAYLHDELDGDVRIFMDEGIHVGADYVSSLAEGLAHSRAMIALFSGSYFASQWCQHELDLMLDRAGGQAGLVIPVIVHNCDIPHVVKRIQYADLSKYRHPRLNIDGQKYQDFCEAVSTLAPDLHRAICSAPEFSAAWAHKCSSRLTQVYEAELRGDTVAPTWFVAPPRRTLLEPPRFVP